MLLMCLAQNYIEYVLKTWAEFIEMIGYGEASKIITASKMLIFQMKK